jgi:general secretion pathway protein G
MKKRLPNGFTLIELLVVVSLIGILATLVLANLNAARQRGRDAQRKSDLKSIQNGLQVYYNDFGKYPDNNSSGEILGCGSGGTSTCTYGATWTADGNTYMQTLPADPISTQGYVYDQLGLDNYTLTTCLENSSDEDGQAQSGVDCDSDWMYQISQ